MTFSIGRVGLDVTLDNPDKVTDTGDKVTFEQQAQTCSSLNDFRVLQQQLTGLKNNADEPFVPVVWSDDASFTGYYRVSNVEIGLVTASLSAFVFPWKIELERVYQYAQPTIEIVSIGKVRTNSSGITAGTELDFYGLSNAAWPVDYAGAYPNVFESRTLNGSTQTWRFQSAPATHSSGYFAIPAANFYTGAARLEWSLDSGSTWRTFVGRSLPNVPYAVRVINDLVTMRFASNSTLDPYFTSFNGSSYGTAKQYVFIEGAGLTTTTGTWGGVTVLRNAPSGVALRFTRGQVGNGDSYYVLDVALRPGGCFVVCKLSTNSATVRGLKLNTVEAATALTGGMRATSNDAGSGHRYVLSVPGGYTTDLVNGKISSSLPVTSFPFMIGAEINGSSASGHAVAQDVIYQYHAATQQTLRLIGR